VFEAFGVRSKQMIIVGDALAFELLKEEERRIG
jgi:hypothetical protein